MKRKTVLTLFGVFISGIVAALLLGADVDTLMYPHPQLVRNQDATATNIQSVVITTTAGATPISATAIAGNYATHVAAYVNTTGTSYNSAVVMVGTSTVTGTGAGFQLLIDDPKGFMIPLPADKIYVISSTTGQKVRANAIVR